MMGDCLPEDDDAHAVKVTRCERGELVMPRGEHETVGALVFDELL